MLTGGWPGCASPCAGQAAWCRVHCCASECQHLHLLHRRGRFLLHLLQLLLLARTAALHLLQRLRLCRGLMPRLDLSCPAQWQLLLPCLPLVALLRVPRSSQPAAGAHTRQPGCDKISLGLGILPTHPMQVQALTGDTPAAVELQSLLPSAGQHQGKGCLPAQHQRRRVWHGLLALWGAALPRAPGSRAARLQMQMCRWHSFCG